MLADRWQTEETPQINMTPMVDVVLCLLIFFMAATRLYDWDEEQFRVSVPEVTDAAPLTSAPGDIELAIIAPGKIVLEGKTLDLKTLKTVLVDARKQYSDQGVLIRGQASLSYQDLADVLAVCEAANIANVRLPVRTKVDDSSTNP
ncbi:MAG: biopolymer transporter ExbD [Isosphaeraceae bacterium]